MKKEYKAGESVAQLDRGSMKRVLNVKDLFAIGYGDLGSSIYYALGVTALYALGATPIALALAGLVFVCTALTYAEMTAMVHESGGSASFARHAFNDLISFIAGWGLLLDYIVTIAISAFAIGPYLAYFHQGIRSSNVTHIGFTIGLIFILFIINFFGVRQSSRMSFALVTFTLLTQAAIIGIGFVTLFDLPYIWDHIKINVAGAAWSPSWPEFFKGTAMAMVAYTGIESIAQLGAEARNPQKTCPRAILITLVVLVFMYLGISVVALSALTPQVLSTKYLEDPIAGIVSALPFGSHFLGPWVGIIAAALLFVASNAGLMGASRLSFNMGEYYQLPRFFYHLHHRFRTPYISLSFFALLAALVVLLSRGRMNFLADLYNFGAMIAFFFAHASLIVLRIKKPNVERAFHAPLNIRVRGYRIPLTAVVGCIATFSVWVLIVITKPEGRYLGFAWMSFGVLMYFYYRKQKKMKFAGQLVLRRVKVPGFKPMKVKHILVPTRGGERTETVQAACELAKLHKAHVTAVHIIEVPASLPFDSEIAEMILRTAEGNAALKRAEAIAREFNVPIELHILRSRSTSDTILSILKQKHHDLLVIGATTQAKEKGHKMYGTVTEKILRHSPCRVWLCFNTIPKK